MVIIQTRIVLARAIIVATPLNQSANLRVKTNTLTKVFNGGMLIFHRSTFLCAQSGIAMRVLTAYPPQELASSGVMRNLSVVGNTLTELATSLKAARSVSSAVETSPQQLRLLPRQLPPRFVIAKVTKLVAGTIVATDTPHAKLVQTAMWRIMRIVLTLVTAVIQIPKSVSLGATAKLLKMARSGGALYQVSQNLYVRCGIVTDAQNANRLHRNA
jgi:hypothetical protein